MIGRCVVASVTGRLSATWNVISRSTCWPERSSEGLKRWLQAHPSVEVIGRDRADEYIKGATEGAHEAVQVAGWRERSQRGRSSERGPAQREVRIRRPSSRRVAWILMKDHAELDDEERLLRRQMRHRCSALRRTGSPARWLAGSNDGSAQVEKADWTPGWAGPVMLKHRRH